MKNQRNVQRIEKQDLLAKLLQIHSIFYTIQGEGPYCGHPAVFVRLTGCNLQCGGCDTDYTSRRVNMTVLEIECEIQNAWSKQHDPNHFALPLIVITGGEPFRQNIAPLVRTLVSKGYKVQIETNGTLFVEDIPWNSVTVVCSPKTGKINEKLLPHIDAFKYVIKAGSVDPVDGLPIFALDHTAVPKVARPPVGNTKPVYVQPMDEQDIPRNLINQGVAVASCMKYGYIMQIQLHKILQME